MMHPPKVIALRAVCDSCGDSAVLPVPRDEWERFRQAGVAWWMAHYRPRVYASDVLVDGRAATIPVVM